MKFKIWLIIIALLFTAQTFSQCNPYTTYGLPIFNDSLPCIVKGVPYSGTVSFQSMAYDSNGMPMTPLDSVRIDSITNLPCGITWQANKASRVYAGNEIGCITLSGTTSDPEGQYKLSIHISVYIFGLLESGTTDSIFPGGPSYLKIKASAGSPCLNIDTFVTANNLTASCHTPNPLHNPIADMWPGDANSDGVVDANDVLQIAVEYGSTGPLRSNATLNWVAQPATDWAAFTYGINDKHADGDGNGIINANDTLAVAQNYSLTHQKMNDAKAQPSDPTLSFVLSTSDIAQDQNLGIKVMLGDVTTQVDTIYGIAFSMNLDTTIFDVSTISMMLGTSWLGSASEAFSFTKTVANAGKIDVALARIDHQNINGYGQIGELMLKTKLLLSRPTHITITPTTINAITASGTTKTFNTQSTTLGVSIVGINEPTLSQHITLYPNPSNGHFTLTINQASKTLNIELLNVQGQQVYTEQLKDLTSLQKELNFTDLAKGVYLLKVSTENGVGVKRVVME